MKNNNTAIKLVGALVLGAAAGAIVGILFAPDKGSETRKRFTSKANDAKDSLKEKFNDLMTDARNDKGHELTNNKVGKTEKS